MMRRNVSLLFPGSDHAMKKIKAADLHRWRKVRIVLLLCAVIFSPPLVGNVFPDDFRVTAFRIISKNGGRVDWDPSGSNRIAYDKKNEDGYYDVYTMLPDGSGRISLTDGKPGIWQRQNGNPCWHPSGKYLVFQSEHPKHLAVRDKWPSNPGVGVYNELWATTPSGDRFWQLTHHEVKMRLFDGKKAVGVLNPHFSHDGSKLIWTERMGKGGKWGRWRIRMAEFRIDPEQGPTLHSLRSVFTPTENMGNYVTCTGMTPDGKFLLLAGNLGGPGQDEFGMDLYLYNLADHTLKDLTKDWKEWTEGSAISPDGKKIIYMSNKGSPMDFRDKHWYWQKRTREYWIMNLDGSGKRQVTHLNTPGFPDSQHRPFIVADCSWSPDGKRLVSTAGEDMGPADKAEIHLRVGLFTFNRAP